MTTAFIAAGVRRFLISLVGQRFRQMTFSEAQHLAARRATWQEIDPVLARQIAQRAQGQKSGRTNSELSVMVLRSITYEDFIGTLHSTNPELLKQMLSDTETASWLGQLWREVETQRG